jgi:hypothetical protein
VGRSEGRGDRAVTFLLDHDDVSVGLLRAPEVIEIVTLRGCILAPLIQGL